jgi:hypothetical protein
MDGDSVQPLAASNVCDLVKIVVSHATTLPTNHFLWFRGVSCSEFALLPSLLRGSTREMTVVLERELRLLTRFRQRSLPYWASGYPQTDWEHLFAMQHHGMPTRLLDWSENLFVALYFALMPTNPHTTEDPAHKCTPVVWILDPKTWNQRALDHQDGSAHGTSVLTSTDEELRFYAPFDQSSRLMKRYRTPVALYGTHNSARIVAQRGAFTIAGNEWKGMEEFAKAMPKPELGGLDRVLITADVASARRELQLLGFTESMIYPDLPGLSRELAEAEAWPT